MYNSSKEAFFTRLFNDGITATDIEADRDPYVVKANLTEWGSVKSFNLTEATKSGQSNCTCDWCREKYRRAIAMERFCATGKGL